MNIKTSALRKYVPMRPQRVLNTVNKWLLKSICEWIISYGVSIAAMIAPKIHMRVDNLRAATNVEMLLSSRIGRRHMLRHDRQGQYAMDLLNGMRLIFEKHGTTIQIAYIMEITDYH